ncbi:MAG: sugar phosphate nucleotidyltransferase [Spirochaetes bacterium]|jgi:choline kinase|nr:sugar phosphate nucleotidyltransferase [Spirochaetota bacterium]
MKALILNSGVGKRMGNLTADRPKCMVEVEGGLSTLDFQLCILEKCGISDVVITTGPFEEMLQKHVSQTYPFLNVIYVNNPEYKKTNYIYSIALAKDQLDDDIILMHGDLLFEESVFQDILLSKSSVMVVDSTLPLPEKDFKAVIDNNRITRVGIEFFKDACAAQPLYKLLKNDWTLWLNKIIEFCDNGIRDVYAENALNEISTSINIEGCDIKGRLCGEIDTKEDLIKIKKFLKS